MELVIKGVRVFCWMDALLFSSQTTSMITSFVLIGSPLQLFKDDIMYLLTMDKLWKKRKAPIPLDWQQLKNSGMSA